MRKILILIFNIICVFLLSICAFAESEIEIYNRGEKVELNHDLVYENEQYYIHIDDLSLLDLEVSDESDLMTVITSNDCLGVERKLEIEKKEASDHVIIKPSMPGPPYGNILKPVGPYITVSPDGEIIDSEITDVGIGDINIDNSVIIAGSGNVFYYGRSTKEIKVEDYIDSDDEFINIYYDGIRFTDKEASINVDDEDYFSLRLIGKKLSHSYTVSDNRIDLYITDTERLIFTTTVNFKNNEVAPIGGWNVNIYAAEKTGEGNELSDFTIISEKSCTILENENSVSCLIEIPADKITDNTFYYIADLGGRYALAIEEYDFSKVGNVLVYGWQKDITYTGIINLPQITETDVTYTLYVSADGKKFSKQGTVSSGVKSSVCEISEIPLAETVVARVIFDDRKYMNGYLRDETYVPRLGLHRNDLSDEYTAKLSKEIMCTLSLPQDYLCENDVEVTLSLKKVTSGMQVDGNIGVNLGYNDGNLNTNETLNIVLNNDNRSVTLSIYGVTNEFKLEYKIKSDTLDLYNTGYYGKNGETTSDTDLAKIFNGSDIAEITLLKCKNITVSVERPEQLSLNTDIYGELFVFKHTGIMAKGVQINSSETPVVLAGKRAGEFSFEISEDQQFSTMIQNITGDEDVFEYCYYVEDGTSSVKGINKKLISYSDNTVTLKLVECYNVSGIVESELENPYYTVTAKCKLFDDTILEANATITNGEFSIKIPADAHSYILGAETRVKVKSFYVSNSLSSSEEMSATQITDLSDKSDFIIKYNIQNPDYPIEISFINSSYYVDIKNISDYNIENIDIYIAYYGENNKLLSITYNTLDKLISGFSKSYKYSNNISGVIDIKVFVWRSGTLIPLGKN